MIATRKLSRLPLWVGVDSQRGIDFYQPVSIGSILGSV